MSTSSNHWTGIPRDTSSEAYQVQCEVLRRMSPSQRLQQAFDLMDFAESIAAAGIRCRHPNYNAEQVRMALARMRLGNDLFRLAFPNVEVAP